MTDTKKRHSAAFKARVALEAAKQTRTLAELSGTFGSSVLNSSFHEKPYNN